MRLIFASNHDHPLRIDAYDRRYAAYDVLQPEDMIGSSETAASKAALKDQSRMIWRWPSD
jgi:hypothetical protein